MVTILNVIIVFLTDYVVNNFEQEKSYCVFTNQVDFQFNIQCIVYAEVLRIYRGDSIYDFYFKITRAIGRDVH